jgi:hypothetical protein
MTKKPLLFLPLIEIILLLLLGCMTTITKISWLFPYSNYNSLKLSLWSTLNIFLHLPKSSMFWNIKALLCFIFIALSKLTFNYLNLTNRLFLQCIISCAGRAECKWLTEPLQFSQFLEVQKYIFRTIDISSLSVAFGMLQLVLF